MGIEFIYYKYWLILNLKNDYKSECKLHKHSQYKNNDKAYRNKEVNEKRLKKD